MISGEGREAVQPCFLVFQLSLYSNVFRTPSLYTTIYQPISKDVCTKKKKKAKQNSFSSQKFDSYFMYFNAFYRMGQRFKLHTFVHLIYLTLSPQILV